MAGHGGARPNAGRISNAQKLLDAKAYAKALQGWFTPELQESSWRQLIAEEDANVRIKAISYLTDRLYGKAAQAVDVQHGGEIEVSVKRVINDV